MLKSNFENKMLSFEYKSISECIYSSNSESLFTRFVSPERSIRHISSQKFMRLFIYIRGTGGPKSFVVNIFFNKEHQSDSDLLKIRNYYTYFIGYFV